jgi:hypothetical protein
VTVDAGNGSGGTVTRVASGTYDMGFADLAALMEFHANNPDAPNKPVAVMMVYNNTPAAVLALKKSGITNPADLAARSSARRCSTPGRKAFPIFAKANGIGGVAWSAWTRRCARPCSCAATSTPSPASLHLAAEPRSARRQGRGHRRAALPAARREAVRQRDHRQPRVPEGEPGR